MKLRHLLTPVAIATLAVAPVAATTAAHAADDHSQTFVDEDAATPANAVNIVKTRVFTTATDYRAVVTYKTYNKLAATRYNVAFQTAYVDDDSSGNLLDLRIDPSGKASLLAYGLDGKNDKLVKSSCPGNKVFSGKNTLTFVIAKKCWYSQYSPTGVFAGTQHYTSASSYAKGTPSDPYEVEGETATSDQSPTFGDDNDWDWGGPAAPDGNGDGPLKTTPLGRFHL